MQEKAISTAIAGFRFRYRLSGAPPTVERLPLKGTETPVEGDVVKLEAGEVALAAPGDGNLLGAAKERREGTGSATFIDVITDADAVYAVTDGHFRRGPEGLDLNGAAGAQGVCEGPNGDFTVVASSSATEETLVRISVGRQAYDGRRDGILSAALARTVVQLHKQYFGRGPTVAQAFYRNNVIVVLMRDVMTRAERNLASSGQRDAVLDMRRKLQRTMREELVALVERLTGCKVTALMSDNHIDPDMASEVFVLDRPVPAAPPQPDKPPPTGEPSHAGRETTRLLPEER
jgi:uncharacterized protein YbcI